MPEIKSDKPRKKGTICSRGKWFSPLTNTIYSYQSSYEKVFMKFLDEHSIRWIRNTDKFPYLLEDKKHNYIPDFYLLDYDMYIETKGFVRKSDPLKFEAFPDNKNLTLLVYEDMIKLGCKVFNPITDTQVDYNKWPMSILGKLSEWQKPGELSAKLKEKVSSKKFFDILYNLNI